MLNFKLDGTGILQGNAFHWAIQLVMYVVLMLDKDTAQLLINYFYGLCDTVAKLKLVQFRCIKPWEAKLLILDLMNRFHCF